MVRRFQNNVINKDVAFAVTIAEKLFHPDSFMMQEIKVKDDFKFESGKGIDVYVRILTCQTVAPIFTYKPKWIFTKALGYSDGKAIHLNLRKLDGLELTELVGLLAHEYLHLVGLGHGNNFPSKDKDLFSVNYFVSSNVSRWL